MQDSTPYGYIQVGFGTDTHRLAPGTGITLGGVFIPCEYGMVAVSDGDVLLHALTDALLGSCGLGDIGEHFPASAVVQDAPSGPMLHQVLTLVREKGATVVNVDCVIDCEAIRLGELKKRIRRNLADLLQLAPLRVNVKAKTAEGLGPVGEGGAVSAQAVVLVSFSEGRCRA
ncbi:MAG: 2-C-methyl-D-erythritol 2,4-cyclodiphosphate synthase [Planctomycetaceae bacterium]|nr:2-C-methyl-D-erythritol 2,4-cyclodiphosphate synthase [Planctomycetaceae bacterium]